VSKSVKRYKEFAYTVTKKVATYLYNKCDVILVPSSEIRHVLVREKIRPPKKIVHVGTDSDSFVPGNRGEAKKKLKFRRKDIVIGYVGRIAREKDLGTLERAFVILRKKYRDIQLLVVGEGIPEEVERLRKSGVTLVGGQDNVVPYYQAMDMFVLSSLTETSSIATMEAMSCGKAVVVTPVGFLRSYVKEGINGLFFGRGNVRKLVEQLEKLIGDPGLREQLGLRARATIIERFPWENTVSDIKKVLG
jgi:glycosyltransferase involved in cell wall biosynthesis